MTTFVSNAQHKIYRFLRYKFRLATSPLRAMPNFIIAGTEKGGTSLLFKTLGHHRQVRTSMIKEVSFFKNASLENLFLDQLFFLKIRKKSWNI